MEQMTMTKSKRNGLVMLFCCLILYINWLYLSRREELLTQDTTEIATWAQSPPANPSSPSTSGSTKIKTAKKYKHNHKERLPQMILVNPLSKDSSFRTKKPYPLQGKDKTFRTATVVIQPIDINFADQKAWESLPGIGPYYAKLILNYRNKLGGFSQLEQIKETWNLPDSIFQKALPFLIFNQGVQKRINLNTCDEAELAAHPYISEYQAKAIVKYRFQHGKFNQVEDIYNIRLLPKAWVEKILPYFTTEFDLVQSTNNG